MKVLFALLMAGLAVAGPAVADKDHDRARRAVEEGRILPLKEILARAQKAEPGQVIEAELEDERGAIVYEIKMLTADGRMLKLYFDAASGALLKVKGRDRQR